MMIQYTCSSVCVCACVRACVQACVRACVCTKVDGVAVTPIMGVVQHLLGRTISGVFSCPPGVFTDTF